MMIVTTTTALVVRVRCEGRWDVGDSMMPRHIDRGRGGLGVECFYMLIDGTRMLLT